MALSGKVFTMADTNTETFGNLLKQLGSLLGVGPRSDGRYYLSDMCVASSVNMWAKFKSEDFDVAVNLSESQRKANNYGFGTTPTLTTSSSGIGHAVWNNYIKPAHQKRIRDFDGYRHDAVAPIGHSILPSNGYVIMEQQWGVTASFIRNTGWSESDCVRLCDIVDATTKTYYLALLIQKIGGNSWLIPSNKLVKDVTSETGIQVIPSSSYGVAGATIWSEMADSANEGAEYTVAVVASPHAPKASGNYYTAYTQGTFSNIKSLELLYGKDRFNFTFKSAQSIVGITGYLNTTLSGNYTTATDSNDSSMKVIKPNSSLPLRVYITTPSSWLRENVYINVKIENSTGTIYKNGVAQGYSVNIGATATIGAGKSLNFTVLSALSAYTFQYSSICRLRFTVTAWRNSNMTGESVRLDLDDLQLS